MELEPLTLKPIGYIQTCFNEKFGVPRQSLMMSEAKGVIKLNPDPRFREAIRTLSEFSHIWIIFVFDQNDSEWKSLTTLPRLDVHNRVGVFASRSPNRPNPIGMSAVKLDRVDERAKEGIEIHVSGVDLLDGTAILDIKPYVPYVDSVVDAKGAWTDTQIPKHPVYYSDMALKQISEHEKNIMPLLQQMLELDPRPTSQKKSALIEDIKSNGVKFAFRIFDFDVQCEVKDQGIFVKELIKLTTK